MEFSLGPSHFVIVPSVHFGWSCHYSLLWLELAIELVVHGVLTLKLFLQSILWSSQLAKYSLQKYLFTSFQNEKG